MVLLVYLNYFWRSYQGITFKNNYGFLPPLPYLFCFWYSSFTHRSCIIILLSIIAKTWIAPYPLVCIFNYLFILFLFKLFWGFVLGRKCTPCYFVNIIWHLIDLRKKENERVKRNVGLIFNTHSKLPHLSKETFSLKFWLETWSDLIFFHVIQLVTWT